MKSYILFLCLLFSFSIANLYTSEYIEKSKQFLNKVSVKKTLGYAVTAGIVCTGMYIGYKFYSEQVSKYDDLETAAAQGLNSIFDQKNKGSETDEGNDTVNQ